MISRYATTVAELERLCPTADLRYVSLLVNGRFGFYEGCELVAMSVDQVRQYPSLGHFLSHQKELAVWWRAQATQISGVSGQCVGAVNDQKNENK